MSESIPAWLIDAGSGLQIAVGQHEIAGYETSIILHPVPQTPEYCHHVMFWRDEIVPVLNLSVMAGLSESVEEMKSVALLMYQEAPKTPLQTIAISLVSPPERIMINDDDMCESMEDFPESLKSVVISLVRHREKITGILDIGRLCSKPDHIGNESMEIAV